MSRPRAWSDDQIQDAIIEAYLEPQKSLASLHKDLKNLGFVVDTVRLKYIRDGLIERAMKLLRDEVESEEA